MPVIKVSAETWNEVKAAEKTIRLAFGEVLLKEKDKGASLRELGEEHGISHMTVANLIKQAETRHAELEKVTA